jgi:hypothetical protein
MSGTISGSDLRCNGMPITLTGTFSATLQAEATGHPTGRGVLQVLRDAVRLQ